MNHVRATEVVSALNQGFEIHSRAAQLTTGKSSPSNPSIVELLEEAHFSQVSCARDKVFVLYGLFATVNFKMATPDYTKPVAQIYRETAVTVITSTGTLDILDQIHGLGNTPEPVSCSPDWARIRHSIIPGQARGGSHLVSGNSAPRFRFDNRGQHLHVKGLLIDQIAARAAASIAHGHEGMGPANDYIRWTQNAPLFDPFWVNMLETNPHHSRIILHIWNNRVFKILVEFAFQQLGTSKNTSH